MNLSKNPNIHLMAINNGIMSHMKECLKLHDYEVQAFLFTAIGNFLVSPEADVRRKTVH